MPDAFWEKLVAAAKKLTAEGGTVPSRMPNKPQSEPARPLLVDHPQEAPALVLDRTDPSIAEHPDPIHLNRSAAKDEMTDHRTTGGTTGGYGSSYWSYENQKGQEMEHMPPLSEETKALVLKWREEEARRQRTEAILKQLNGNN